MHMSLPVAKHTFYIIVDMLGFFNYCNHNPNRRDIISIKWFIIIITNGVYL